MKRKLALLLTSIMVIGTLVTGCGKEETSEDLSTMTGRIKVISREDGSGTRGAFVELFGVEEKNDAGEKMDMTTLDAQITNSTAVMMTSVSGNSKAIGYISLGSMDETVVKALDIDGVEASVENVKSGSYKVSRPFNIVTDDAPSEVTKDFIAFIMSAEGQAIVEETGYIAAAEGAAYEGVSPEGKITIAGSSSVTPVMEKLAEGYAVYNPNAVIEVQQSDSTTGVNSVMEGICDIGMASRALKDSESGVHATVIALDGIAVIVNTGNPIENLTTENIKDIYTGTVTAWDEIE